MPPRTIVIVAHDIRSTHNVGALFRTAECMGVSHVYLTGYTPYPTTAEDVRLPHIHEKLTRQIHKTALGTENDIQWSHQEDCTGLLRTLSREGYEVVALEQTSTSTSLPRFKPSKKLCLLLGREVEGVDPSLLELCDHIVEIPQYGQKESLNVIQACAIALYHLQTV